MAESFSIKARTAERRWMRNPVRPSSCVTPAGTSNELDVQNEWGENTHTLRGKQLSSCCLKKNENAPRPSEHPPVRGGGMSKRLGRIKGCKYKTSSWHLNGFPDGNNIGSTV